MHDGNHSHLKKLKDKEKIYKWKDTEHIIDSQDSQQM